jgi:AbrB family looped-hinge helix DNA binding protein
MRTTMDAAGRIVIPKAVRDAAGLRPGEPLQVAERDGRVEIEPAGSRVRLVEREGFLAAEIEGYDGPALTVDDVRALLERLRR